MTRTITLLSKVEKAELTGQKAKIVAAVSQLSAEAGKGNTVEFVWLRKKLCRSIKPKALRRAIRQLAAAKLVSVRRVKATA